MRDGQRGWHLALIVIGLCVLANSPMEALARGCDLPRIQEAQSLRVTIEVACEAQGRGCSSAVRRGDYVHCIREQVQDAIGRGDLRPEVGRAIRRCSSESTCGRHGRVACRYGLGTPTSCNITTASVCARRGGVVADCASCCDVCTIACGYPPSPRIDCSERVSCDHCSGGRDCQWCYDLGCVATGTKCDIADDCE
jgi:hypothetical protein